MATTQKVTRPHTQCVFIRKHPVCTIYFASVAEQVTIALIDHKINYADTT